MNKMCAKFFALSFVSLVFFTPARCAGLDTAAGEPPLREIYLAKNRQQKLHAGLNLARWYEKNGDDEKAVETYNQALKENPGRKDTYSIFLAIGDIHLSKKRYAQAIESYQGAASLQSHMDDARIRLAAAYEQSELYELSKQEYIDVLKNNHKSFEANFGLGSLYLKEGLNTRAMEYYKNALMIRPDAQVYRRIADCAENTDDNDLAVAMLRQINSPERTYDDEIKLGRLYEEQKKYKESEESFSKAIGLNGKRIEGYIYLGLFYLEKNELVPAEKLLEIAREKAPGEGLIHFFLAYIYHLKNDNKLALQEAGKAESLAKSGTLLNYSRKFSAFMLKSLPH